MICSAFKKNADAKPQLSGSFFASRHAGTRRLGDPQSAKSRRREILFSGAGRLGLRAVAAVGARGSVPPVEAAVAAAPTSDPVVSAASAAPATSQAVVETAAAAPEPVRQEPAPTLRLQFRRRNRPWRRRREWPPTRARRRELCPPVRRESAEPVAKNKDQPLKSLLERIATCR
nr:Uncharacterised protein [Klebsiella pneumoniae]